MCQNRKLLQTVVMLAFFSHGPKSSSGFAYPFLVVLQGATHAHFVGLPQEKRDPHVPLGPRIGAYSLAPLRREDVSNVKLHAMRRDAGFSGSRGPRKATVWCLVCEWCDFAKISPHSLEDTEESAA